MLKTSTRPPGAANGTEGAAPGLVLRRIIWDAIEVNIAGITELITHQWSVKAKTAMLEAQQSRTRAKKAPKDPKADFEESMYRFHDGRHGFPASGFKAAIVGGCRQFDGLPMTQAKVALYVRGEGPDQLVEIVRPESGGEWPRQREDMVRLESGVADLRYRAGYFPWSARLRIEFNPTILTAESVIALVDAAGRGGVGEWRPSAPKSSSGSFGMFEVREG